MREVIEANNFNIRIWPSDWRYSAAIVGLIKFFEFQDLQYSIDSAEYLEFPSQNLKSSNFEGQYLLFAEDFFVDSMHHRTIEALLKKDELNENEVKLVNEKLKANVVCKKVFGKLQYSEDTKEEISYLIKENRLNLIKETFRSGKALYAKYANTNKLLSDGDKVCRLLGYYVDLPKKSKSISFNWDYGTFVSEDILEFDFIPFAFTRMRESYFINNNYDVGKLYHANLYLQRKVENEKNDFNNSETVVFKALRESSMFMGFDVEVIKKSQDKDFYESVYIRKAAMDIMKNITDKMFYALQVPCVLKNGSYLALAKESIDRIVNLVHLDDLIERLLKEKGKAMQTGILIRINMLIYGGAYMDVKCYKAKKTAEDVRKKLVGKNAENKINSYQQKLISAITFHDWDRFMEILLQFASYVEMPFDFAYDLFSDFESNKNVAYSFVLGLSKEQEKKEQ